MRSLNLAISFILKEVCSTNTPTKKICFILLVSLAATSLHAQLNNTHWKARIEIDGPVNVIFDFKKDTCQILRLADSGVIETMSYTIKDSILTVQKIDGQSDCDISTIGKYKIELKDNSLVIRLASDDCDDRSTVMDNSKWVPWRIPVEVMLTDAVLKQYTGTYELDDAHPIYVTVESGRLQVEGPNNGLPKTPIYAESETRFFIRLAGVEWDFVKDASGKVTSVISHEEKDYELKKVK